MPIKLESSARTDPGSLRTTNEDTIFQAVIESADKRTIGLFIVADGVSGRLAGQAASYWAVETIKNSLSDLIDYEDPRATNRFNREELLDMYTESGADPDNLEHRVSVAVTRANTMVREYAYRKPDEARSAGSTVTMVLVVNDQAVVANVGDSRTYLLRDGNLRQITKDHSLVQRLIDKGQVRPKDRYTHPQRNLIYRSLGASDTVRVDVFTASLTDGDYLLLCSDGLWEMVQSKSSIVDIVVGSPSLEVASGRLVDAANAAGGVDNISVILVRAHS